MAPSKTAAIGAAGSAVALTRRVAIVPHTHWDREWYAPFEAFRARLVEVLDKLLAAMDQDPSYSTFLLDGQMAVVDDYLEVRPDAAETLKRLAGAGRVLMGPWYILMDEFCVSGETIVRDLQLGLETAEQFGGAMPIGYLPDMFGHIAEMPQLLRLAGMEHAVVWRGVPKAVNRTGFWWEAPDGSTVRAEYLPTGYASGASLPRDAAALLRRIGAYEAEVAQFLSSDGAILLMNGTDHQAPQLFLSRLIRDSNAAQDRYRLEQTSLPDYLAAAPTEGLPRWQGELRSGARANLLRGVLSNRVDVKQAAATTERMLERLAEPLATLWLPPDCYPDDLIQRAWRELIRNSAHDSVCACSADQIGRAVISRYDSAAALAGEATRRALEIAAVAVPGRSLAVINPSPNPAAGVIELSLPGLEPPTGTQSLSSTPPGIEERIGRGGELGRILARLTIDGWLTHNRGTTANVGVNTDGVELTIVADASEPASPELAVRMAEAYAQAGAHRDEPLTVRVDRRASQRVAARVSGVPAWGWSVWAPAELDVAPIVASEGWMDNSLVRLDVNPQDGSFSLADASGRGVAGLDRLVDSGDEGDTYTYSPPESDFEVDNPESVSVEVLETGPVRGRLAVRRTFAWPVRVESGQRAGLARVEVLTILEMVAGDPLVRVSTSFDNPCRDRRLRAWFPLPEPANAVLAECAFATVRRGPAEGGPGEAAQGTWPSRRFVSAGGVTVTHEGLLEYELVDGGTALAITLLRSTGWLSRPAPAARPNSAGPPVPVESAQMLGPFRCRYAVAVGAEDPWRIAERAWTALPVVRGSGIGHLAPHGARLTVSGAEVSALHRVGDGTIELRVFNPSDEAAKVRVAGHSGWLVDLRGEHLVRFEDSFELRPWAIATARLDAVSLD